MYVEDRLITPYIIWEHLPTQTKYVKFPLFEYAEYQRRKYYSDERPLTLKEFNKMRKHQD